MIIRENERRVEVAEQMRGGDGCIIKQLYEPAQMPPRARLLSEMRIEPGCSIGTHAHKGEYEIFFFKQGELVLNDNGEERVVRAGDMSICYDGEIHGLANPSEETALVYAVIVKTED